MKRKWNGDFKGKGFSNKVRRVDRSSNYQEGARNEVYENAHSDKLAKQKKLKSDLDEANQVLVTRLKEEGLKVENGRRHEVRRPNDLAAATSELSGGHMFASETFEDLKYEDTDPFDSKNYLKTISVSSKYLDSRLVRQLAFCGFQKVTRIQYHAISTLCDKSKDGLIKSDTGSGKTLAFLLPCLNSVLLKEREFRPRGIRMDRSDGTRVLLMCPTRELAQQSLKMSYELTRPFPWIVTGELLGGSKKKSEKARLRKGVSLLVATPGRMEDHLNSTMAFEVRSLEHIVLDEADRLLDMGHGGRVKNIVKMLKEMKEGLVGGRERVKKFEEERLVGIQAAEDREKEKAMGRELARNMILTNPPVVYKRVIDFMDDGNSSEIINKSEELKTEIVNDDTTESGESDHDENNNYQNDSKSEISSNGQIEDEEEEEETWGGHLGIQTILVSATLGGDVVDLAKFCLKKEYVWITSSVDQKTSIDTSSINNSKKMKIEMLEDSDDDDMDSNLRISKNNNLVVKTKNEKYISFEDEDVETENQLLESHSRFSVPQSLKQRTIVLSDVKSRCTVLISILLQSLVTDKQKILVFCNCCATVEFLHSMCESLMWPAKESVFARGPSGLHKQQQKNLEAHKRSQREFDSMFNKIKQRRGEDGNLADINKNKTKINKTDESDNDEYNSFGDDDLDEEERILADEQLETKREFVKSNFTKQKVFEGFKLFKLHGELPSLDRLGDLSDFVSKMKSGVLFTTDVAARGLNMNDVHHVIQFDPPTEIQEYVHRVGRTARLGNEGLSTIILFKHEAQPFLELLQDAGVINKPPAPSNMHILEDSEVLKPLTPPRAGDVMARRRCLLPEELRTDRIKDLPSFLRSRFTVFVTAEPALEARARSAFLSSVRSLRSIPKHMARILDFKVLHLGHFAASFFVSKTPGQIGRDRDQQMTQSKDEDRSSFRSNDKADDEQGVKRPSPLTKVDKPKAKRLGKTRRAQEKQKKLLKQNLAH